MGRHRQFDEGEALEAALSVFWQKGFEGTSIEDLTQATGIARPGLYAAFGNKQQFFLKALDLYEATHMDFMREALEEPTSARVVERMLKGAAAAQTMDTVHLGCLGINGALACSDSAEPVRRELTQRRAASQATLRKRLERAQREGDLPPTVDCATMACFVMTVSQGMAVQAKAGASKETLDALADHVLGTWPKAEPK